MSEESVDSHASAFSAILMAMLQIKKFRKMFSDREEEKLRKFLINQDKPDLEETTNGVVLMMFGKMKRFLVEELSRIFTVEEYSNIKCDACGSERENVAEKDYLPTMSISSLIAADAESESGVEEFEEWFKQYLSSPEVCVKCETNNNVVRELRNMPDTYPIGIKWDINDIDYETKKNAVCLLTTIIELKRIYKYDGEETSYDLVSMVCLREQEHVCVSLEDWYWVLHDFASKEKEEIGNDWQNVTSKLAADAIRPELLLYEKTNWKSSTRPDLMRFKLKRKAETLAIEGCVASDDDVCDRMSKKSKS